jgi:hypothetical protein
MKKIIPFLLVILLICGCTAQGDATEAQVPADSESEQAQTSEPTPEPTPVPLIKSVALQAIVSENEQFLKPLNADADPDFVTEMETPVAELVSSEDDAYYIEFNQDKMNNLQLDTPDMPTFAWYINGSNADKVAQVVIEFDLLETIHPLHPAFFDYDKGYFITLHHAQNIKRAPEGVGSQLDGDIVPVDMPELGEDLRKYAEQEGTHVTITIPYVEFQGAAKDLTLQFLPGATFANLSANLWGADELSETIASEIAQKIDRPEHDLLNEVLSLLHEPNDGQRVPNGTEAVLNEVGSRIGGGELAGLVVNPDGSVNMPVAFYDLGEYAGEVKGKYAVVPEGLIPAFATLSSGSYTSNLQGDMQLQKQYKRNLVDFAFENLMDETGQFYGVYDIEQGKTVATGRKSPALPILSSMCGSSIYGMADTSVLSDEEISFILNSIIANDLIRIGDKLYYAPHGISGDDVMDLKLSDFAISDSLLAILIDYSVDESRLDEKYGVAMLLEGYVNSLKLVAAGQEQNETRLPSSELKVIFKDGGNSYKMQPSDTFNINDPFFANLGIIDPLSCIFPGEGAPFSKLALEATNQSIAESLSGGAEGIYDESQKQSIRECERQYAEIYNMYEIQTTLYECFLHIYNFLQMQPVETAYAPEYDVHTGEMIEAPTDMLYPEFRESMAPMISRIGTPATLMNYNLLVGVFNDETEIVETAKVIVFMYERWTGEGVFRLQGIDNTDPDLYADNGFNIWGYDSLYPMSWCHTAYGSTEPFYNRLGFSFSREGWKEYTMRKLNEKVQNEEELVSIDDAFPLFYDDFPKTIITG